MEWYWWVLIGLGLVLLGFIKIKVFNNIKKSKKVQHHQDED